MDHKQFQKEKVVLACSRAKTSQLILCIAQELIHKILASFL